ncbi:DoxX family protein [Chryseobacterium sp. MP_3.2]|uniref:DoxX family protein n=1 Tax=Chryseobacterium sp. MP_3.2 TaxID=3071712 RepID=UPI002E07AA5C|nr:putative membrane protein [Chryseobacterium sp. MP_3.2]
METLEISKYLLGGFLILVGIMHFLLPKFFMSIMPHYLPAHKTLVLLSGVVEISCGILLLFPNTQTIGAYAAVALFVAVFPANIEMSRQFYVKKKKGFWWTIIRLPFQIGLIYWALQFIK